MRKLFITINWKLLFRSECRPVGAMIAAVHPMTGIRLCWTEQPTGSDIPLPDLRGIADVILRHVQEYLRNAHYNAFWNEDTGIETVLVELP
jgi:hypothetical protein